MVFEIALRHVEPFVALEEVAHVADVVGRQVDDGRRLRAQLLRQRLGVAQVGLVIGRTDADQQQRQVAHPLLRTCERDHTRIVAGQQLGEGGTQLQPHRQRRRDVNTSIAAATTRHGFRANQPWKRLIRLCDGGTMALQKYQGLRAWRAIVQRRDLRILVGADMLETCRRLAPHCGPRLSQPSSVSPGVVRTPGIRGRRGDHRRPRDGQCANGGVDRSLGRGRLHRRHDGGRHAGHRARAAQHDRPVRRRECLVGAARLRRAHQHLGQGQVPVGAGADRFVVGEQQGVRAAVRPRQPVRARQAAGAGRAPGHRRFGRGPRLPRPVAVRVVDLLAAAVVHGARRVP